MNHCKITGLLGKDAEMRTGTSGVKYTKFSVAVSDKKKNTTTWFNVVCFNTLAEKAQYFRKGEAVHVEGPISVSSYMSKTGECRARVEVIGNVVESLSGEKADLPGDDPEFGTSVRDGGNFQNEVLNAGKDSDVDIPF